MRSQGLKLREAVNRARSDGRPVRDRLRRDFIEQDGWSKCLLVDAGPGLQSGLAKYLVHHAVPGSKEKNHAFRTSSTTTCPNLKQNSNHFLKRSRRDISYLAQFPPPVRKNLCRAERLAG